MSDVPPGTGGSVYGDRGNSTNDLRNAASEGLQNVTIRISGVVDRVADVADDVTRSGQAVRDDVADAVGRGAHAVGRGLARVSPRPLGAGKEITS